MTMASRPLSPQWLNTLNASSVNGVANVHVTTAPGSICWLEVVPTVLSIMCEWEDVMSVVVLTIPELSPGVVIVVFDIDEQNCIMLPSDGVQSAMA